MAARRKFQVSETGLDRLFGVHDANLRELERHLQVRIHARGGSVVVEGSPEGARRAEEVLTTFSEYLQRGIPFGEGDFRSALTRPWDASFTQADREPSSFDVLSTGDKEVRPRGPNQRLYLGAIATSDLVLGVGPAGTGKTYLAMAAAVSALQARLVHRIVLTRPALEAGERLGFLPGDMFEKVHPYLRPLYDALYDLLKSDRAARLIERGQIEIAPLAFMRGRTLNDAFVILDEAQNTTSEQMKMFLTRLGIKSKAVVTGDITQIDLPSGKVSGMVEALEVVGELEGVAVVRFDERDVVRHPLVQKIVRAYDQFETQREISGPAVEEE
jgi:phosphate starvation-inducible PhoH-like protein